MNEFFTWTTLATYAGATAAVGLITQLFKGVGFIDKIPTRITSYAIALVVLLCVINAVVVSLAANGAYDALAGAPKKHIE